MVGLGLNLEESVGSQRQDHFVNLKRRNDKEVSMHTPILARASLAVGATFLIKRMPEPCN